jgi:PKD repeat protein
MDEGPVALYGVRPTYKFDNLGIYVVTLNVTDFAGNWGTDSLTVTVIDMTAPVANAGSDQTIDEGTQVTFNGSKSSDNIGCANYTWAFMDRAPVTLHGVLPAYQFDNPGTFIVTLNVTDAAGNWNTSTVIVTVNDITAPLADAGLDRTIDEGTLLAFNGTGSSDEVGVVDYTWTFTDRTHITLFGAQPEYQFDHSGIFVVTLTVTDAAGNVGMDTMTVTVKDVTRPVAIAGLDKVINEGTILLFDGTVSYDNAGIVNYTWTFIDGTPVTLYGSRPTYRFDNPGIFIVTLNVTDAAGNQDTNTITVTVKDITEPVADAGPDRTVDEGTMVTFDGSGSYDNVGIVNYTWTFDRGTRRIVLYGDSPSFTFRDPGIYHITVVVSDAAGFWGEDNMTLMVRDITPPVANAGLDQRVPAGSIVVFNGSLSTDNCIIKTYSWDISCNGKAESLEGENVSFLFDKAGVYDVVLTVVDGAGNRGEDRVVVTVEPPVNVDKGGPWGLPWMPLPLIAIAVAGLAGYIVMRRRKIRKGGPMQENESLLGHRGRNSG